MHCERHNLAAGPDGACALCRRAAANREAHAANRAVALGLGAITVVVAAGVAFRMLPRIASFSPERAAAVVAPSPSRASVLAPESAPVEARSEVDPVHAAQLRAWRASTSTNEGASPGTTPPVASAPSPEPPRAVAQAKAIPDVPVVVYTASWCSVCKRAKGWMASAGIPFEEHDVEASADAGRRLRALNPRGSVPTFDVDGEVLVGFSPEDLLATMKRAEAHKDSRLPW